MNTLRLAVIAAAFVIVAPSAFAQNATTRALNAKDQEMTTAIPKAQRAPRGKMRHRETASERMQNRISRENDMTTGFAKQGPARRAMAPNPSARDLRQERMGVQKDQEMTTGIPARR
jgi:hypothetical protein